MGFSTADQFNQTPMVRGGPAAYGEDLQDTGTDPNQQTLPPGSDMPGMGGKASMGINPQTNIPQPPTMNPPQTGLPGLPVPVAPMVPLGPSLGNPGGQGVQPQQISRPAPTPTPMPPPLFNQNKPQIIGGPARPVFDRMMPGRGTQSAMPQNRIARPQPVRGAGRGGMIR